jgi:type II secretory ATPase GspE/PulE/Tfp pilus assembly ATPase PilB-like protein
MGTDEIKRLIQSKARVDEIRSQAIKDGMTTLKQDGIEKIFTGDLDLLQVRKVCIK